METNEFQKNDNISSIKETFDFFYPNEGQPKPSSLSFHLALALMHEATMTSRKFAVAVGVMKSIPNLSPLNAGKWLADLPKSILKELWRSNNEVYVAVKAAVSHGFHQAFVDLSLDTNTEGVKKFLSKYNSVLGTNY